MATVSPVERFEVAMPMAVGAMVHWRAPLTTGFEAHLPPGMIVVAGDWVAADSDCFPARPEEYSAWERLLVPAADLALRDEYRGYDGFTLVLPKAAIGKSLRRLTGSPRAHEAPGRPRR